MALKPITYLSNAVRAKEIVSVLARNGFADLLQKLDLPPAILKAFELREAINLKIMRAVLARGLSFAFPTQTVHVATLPPPPKSLN